MGFCLDGAMDEGPPETARLRIGLRVDQPRAGSLPFPKGSIISTRRARLELFRLRAAQVGRKAASATLVRCEGLWEGRSLEPTISCEIEFVPSRQELRKASFRKHMIDLAEQAAATFGQKEVWLNVGGRLLRTNAPGEKAPRGLRSGAKAVR